MYRVYLRQPSQTAHISDTHWLVVHHRMTAVDYVSKGKKRKTRRATEAKYPLVTGAHNTHRLNDDDADTDIWLNAGSSMELQEWHWDGYDKDPSPGVHMWSKPGADHPALFSADENVGANANHQGAFFQTTYTNGGLFRKEGD